eukprot:3051936-Alexandrium_andersonii.AAC.1
MLAANARVGSVQDQAVGAWQGEPENASGTHLRTACGALDLWAPATFEATGSRAGGPTWVSSTGKEHRIDFILAPSEWRHQRIEAFAPSEVDLALERVDHYPVAVEFEIAQ